MVAAGCAFVRFYPTRGHRERERVATQQRDTSADPNAEAEVKFLNYYDGLTAYDERHRTFSGDDWESGISNWYGGRGVVCASGQGAIG